MEVIHVPTEKCGIFTVHVQGTIPKNAPVFLTVPDLGCDHSYYVPFVNAYMKSRFCWCHVELPGQSFGAPDWNTDADDSATPEENVQHLSPKVSKNLYPTMQELAEGVQAVMEQLEISQAVLFGEGAGANLLSRVAILCDARVLGLILVHGRCTQSGPLQLLREKMRNWKSNKLEPATERYLLEHRFSKTSEVGLMEPLKSEFLQYKSNLVDRVNIKNLNLLTYSYAHRKSLADMIPQLNCPVLLIAGTKSDHRGGVRNMFETINKANKQNPQTRTIVDLIEIENTLSPLIEKPEKLAESTMFFLQGLGLVSSVRYSVIPHSAELNPTEQTPISTSPERRACEHLINLDPKPCPDAPNLQPDQSGVAELEHFPVSPRYFNRQMSMAELDLPRGPDSLSSHKATVTTTSRSPNHKRSVHEDPHPIVGLVHHTRGN